ncbi:polysaccharide deacetylase family protein [Streptomyces torulosus]|uniref:polysaccharide deacetylase family protein n=1 Tax=Streptomyces torulosus TaxID=68276 RepID=UPI0006EB9F8A|nr:polysaccharide deacetylase family protein [Streptomyces torulosus]
MLYAGIAWDAGGYEIEVVDESGAAAAPRARFGADRIADLVGHLRGLGQERLVTVVESTNGILDGRLMAAGLTVFRADPHLLPSRTAFGSAPAAAIARAAAGAPSALARLVRTRGTQTGREPELEAWIAGTTSEVARLTADGLLVSHGGRDRKEIALTFDDGPQPGNTERVLDVLGRYGVPATFFCVGMNARAHPDILTRMREQGHGFGNHTWSHPFLPELTRSQLTEQIERTQEAIAEASGGPAPTLFRPPYGSRTPEVLGWLAESGLTTALWDVVPDDWSMPGTDTVARVVLDQARPGSVVLLHDGGGDRSQTVDALPVMIEGLLERGYRFTRLDAMTAPTDDAAGQAPAAVSSTLA